MKIAQLSFKYEGATDYLKSFADMVTGNWGASRPGIRKLVKGLVDQQLPLSDDSTNGSTAVEIQLGGVPASATGTFTGQPTAADTITLGGTAITARASGAVNNEFNIGTTTQETAQNLVAAINSSTTAAISKTVRATYSDLSTSKATGYIQFTGQPTAAETVTVNGVVFTARASGATGNEFNIGATVSDTVDNLLYALQATDDTAIYNKITFAKATTTGTQATAVLTMTGNPTAAQTFTIGSTVFTARASGATGDEFNITSANPTTTAASLVTAFNASANVNTLFTAAAAANAGNKATGVLTLTGDATAGQTFTVNGVVFTARASGATGNEFNITAGDITTTAAHIVTAWNASATPGATVITATSALGVVTFQSDVHGSVGNAITCTETLSHATFAGATFSGGTDSIAITFTVIVPGSAGNAYASTETLSNASFAGATFSGGADNIKINCTAETAGTVGNAYTLAEAATNVTVSGANLSGGVDDVTITIKAKQSGEIGNYYTVTESMNNFTITGSGKLAGGTASDYYSFGPASGSY